MGQRVTPMINVDLLIKKMIRMKHCSLGDDSYYPAGWHIQGGNGLQRNDF